MRVYRFEHKSHGYGPYSNKKDKFPWPFALVDIPGPHEDMGFSRFYEEVINSPLFDDNSESHPHYFFGFNCLDKLFDAVLPKGFAVLEEWGYVLTEWEVTEDYYILPCGQVFFNKPNAKRVG